LLFAGRRVLEQIDEFGNLRRIQWLGDDAKLSPFGYVFTIGF
jgi:hypothetical protein